MGGDGEKLKLGEGELSAGGGLEVSGETSLIGPQNVQVVGKASETQNCNADVHMISSGHLTENNREQFLTEYEHFKI